MNWDDLRVFLAIAREGTLSAAARRLKVDQSTVSRRLMALEQASGTRLFDRTPEGYILTAAGEGVLPKAEEIESTTISVERKLLADSAGFEGQVRVATSDGFAAWFLVPRLAELRAQHPGISLEFVVGNQPVNLARREADLSMRFRKPTQPQIVARRLGRAAWALYASAEYVARNDRAFSRRGLQGHDVVAFSEELHGTVGATWLREQGGLARVVFQSDSLLSQGAAVVAGLGVGPLPCLYGDVHPGLERVRRAVIGYHDIWLVVHPDVRSSARVRAVMDVLIDIVAQEAPLLSGRSVRKTTPAP